MVFVSAMMILFLFQRDISRVCNLDVTPLPRMQPWQGLNIGIRKPSGECYWEGR